jgi:hypothetical protein
VLSNSQVIELQGNWVVNSLPEPGLFPKRVGSDDDMLAVPPGLKRRSRVLGSLPVCDLLLLATMLILAFWPIVG